MIPTSLKLHNFTAYGADTPELDLRSLKLTVLTGNNGAGKSSLLDAITWSVWGWSRAGDNSDRLVRMGENEMWVEFSFILHETEYRIFRTRKTNGSGSTSLQFFAHPLSNKGSHFERDKTKNKNEYDQPKVINLTEGTIKATQEKIIDTLHLTYETFINSSYLRQGHADEFTLKGPNDRKKILADILGLSTYDQLEERAKLAAKELSDQIRLLEMQIVELESEVVNSSIHEDEQSRTEQELREVQVQLVLAEKTLTEATTKRDKYMVDVEVERDKEKRLLKMKEDLSDLEKELIDKRNELLKLKGLIDDEESIEKGYAELLAERKSLEEAEQVRSELIKKKNELISLESSVTNDRLEHERELQEVRSKAAQVKVELEKLEKDLAKTQSDQAICPTCGQKLGKDEHVKVLTDLKEKLGGKNEELMALRKLYKKLDNFEPPGAKDLEIKKEEVEKLEDRAAPAIKLRIRVAGLNEFEEKKRDLDVAAARENEIKITGLKLKNQADKLKKDIEAVGEISLNNLERELSEVSLEMRKYDQLVRQLRSDETGKKETLAATRQLITRVTQMQRTLENKRKERASSEQSKKDYEDLALAFGKKGIQAMLIESAIPEIEEEANLLLDKLTDGRMKVELLTQRETKTSGIAETLDIVISDELGSRVYDMYSGGEGFRINIALRLALSRLLTRRAGARLQFLIIDEGFGTQDTQGKDKVVEAINAISEDFEKILVVTHDAELKDAFPQRIEVVKGSDGSIFEVFD
jgi:exonuclease SbcC